MKLIFVNANPHKKFNREKSKLVKLQIDNSLELGWKAKDIILGTNFPYEYRGVKSILVDDDNYCGINDKRYCYKVSTHIGIICNLFKLGVLSNDEIYWYHDLDAYQLEPVNESILGEAEMAMTDYGWSPKWNLGAIYFKNTARDIFELINKTIYEEKLGDERALRKLISEGKVDSSRYKKLNITHNFGMRYIGHNWKIANKPLQVIHFHPCYKDPNIPDTTMNLFFHGKNEINQVLVPDRLKEIFRRYGFDENYATDCTYGDFLKSIDYE